jgi:CxxC-x17-CxxC domain-containing protein
MELADKVLKCIDCGGEFVFTAGEQLFFQQQHFRNEPKRCKPCKAKRTSGTPHARPETRTTCSKCGAQTTVPFLPTQGRPVLCRHCFQLKRGTSQPAARPGS